MIKIWRGFFTTHITIPKKWIPYEFMFEKNASDKFAGNPNLGMTSFAKKLKKCFSLENQHDFSMI